MVTNEGLSPVTLQLSFIIEYTVMFMFCAILLTYMRYNRQVAFKGDLNAAKKMILPAFEPLFWMLLVTTGIMTTVFTVVLAMDIFPTKVPTLVHESEYAGRQFIFLITIILLFQKSVSIPALRRSMYITLLLACYTIPIASVMLVLDVAGDGNLKASWPLSLARILFLPFYAYIAWRPVDRASKRTLREYCAFAFANQFLYLTTIVLADRDLNQAALVLNYIDLCWASLAPLFIWRLLKADTAHWRGMGQRACELQTDLLRHRKNGNEIHERISSQGLHVLIEMHRKYIIDFAYLEMRHRIGTGSSAVVFNGVLHSKTPCAIKVYTPSEFNEEIVGTFSHEAALCGALNHPNIVQFYGLCISPPTISLICELCVGSLDDITVAMSKRMQSDKRQRLLINLAYMLDATRSVAYLHSFSPAFLHRDLKPSNFLMDFEGNVKLTDFGESRSLPKEHQAAPAHQRIVESLAELPRDQSRKMTVRGTVDYMAPELISGRAGVAIYGEAADVYALAITYWDILYPGQDKYPHYDNNHFKVFTAVMEGERPAFDPELISSLRRLIEGAWHPEPRMRMSTQSLVHSLESIQEEVANALAAEVCPELNRGFGGDVFAEWMEKSGYVSEPSEAVRMGNALMDAGLMHHSKHARGFDCAKDAMYYFDEGKILLNQPIDVTSRSQHKRRTKKKSSYHKLPILEDQDEFAIQTTLKTCDSNSSSSSDEEVSGSLSMPASCLCRRFGQRIEQRAKLPRRRLRQKMRALVEENVLTHNLLANEEQTKELGSFDISGAGVYPSKDASVMA